MTLKFRWILVGAVLLPTACDGSGIGTQRIGKIIDEPAKYMGREVTVAGTVSRTLQLPFLPGIYWLSDGTGEIPVIASGRAPLAPAKVRVHARVEDVAAIGAAPIGLHLVEVRSDAGCPMLLRRLGEAGNCAL